MSESLNVLSIPGFTNLGYRLHARDFAPIDVDLGDKTAVVTGSTGGLGLQAARELAGLGARVAIVGRSAAKIEDALGLLGNGALGFTADLSLMSAVRDVADQMVDSMETIDILINNVGVLLQQREETSEGLEKTFATNLAGHFLLTNRLAGTLKESAPSRVINVSSGGMYTQRIDPDDLNSRAGPYSGKTAYARTKRGQVILTEMWAERLSGSGVVVHAMHPGWAKTSGVAGSLPVFDKVMKPFLRTTGQGADTMVWLAAASEPGRSSGGFWFDREQVPTHATDRTRVEDLERKILWDRLVEITGEDLDQEPGG